MYGLEQQAAEATAAGSDKADVPSLSDGAMRAITIGFVCLQTVAICIWPIIVLIVTRRRSGA
jgi:hypothetical protein